MDKVDVAERVKQLLQTQGFEIHDQLAEILFVGHPDYPLVEFEIKVDEHARV